MLSNRLYYPSNGNWTALPEWGQSFLDLGYALAFEEDKKHRIVVGLALPTRAYAASLIATGVVTGKLNRSVKSNEAIERFQELCALPVGTSLVYRREKELVEVLFDGYDGNNHSMIRLYNGKQTYIIPSKSALQVEFPAKVFTSPSKRTRHITTTVPMFLSHFLGSEFVKVAVSHSHLDCIIVGATNFLSEEIMETLFAIPITGGMFVTGRLQDIIRVRRLTSDSATYRSDIYPTHGKAIEENSQEIPDVVIFDGATSFIKWQSLWRYPHLVALFDQSDLNFDAAMQVFNEEHIKKGSERVAFSKDFTPPIGVPISIYQEIRK